ncbi:MAG: NHL repeat-containing protein [Planctomycetes bacterium]|nr:NHL repeat-containing protein [Planctomycetota bacterium]MCC7173193.1 NHL repeat-containing protein [Planctomycetota bacterium]
MRFAHPLLICASLALTAPLVAEAQTAFSPGRLFVASLGDDVVIELDPTGVEARRLGAGTLVDPRGIAFGPDGNLYVASSTRVHVFAPDGTLVRSLGENTSLSAARGLALGTHGEVFVTSLDRVLVFEIDGTFLREFGQDDDLTVPAGLAIGANGHVFVCSSADNRVFEFDPAGTKVRELGSDGDLSIPIGLAFGPDGRLWVSSLFGANVVGLDVDGTVASGTVVFDDAALAFPTGLAFGPNGDLFVASLVGNGVREFSLGGTYLGSWPSATTAPFPEGVAFSPHRFSARISGELSRTGQKSIKRKEDAVISFTPGSRTLMLALTDVETNTSDLASEFGTDWYVLHGFEAFATPLATTRVFQGFGFVEPVQEAGVASMPMRVSGVTQTSYFAPRFVPKKAAGSLHVADATAVFSGSVKTKKALN